MIAVILAGVATLACVCAGVWGGLKLARAMSERFDELLPQRMVDYAGYVAPPRRD